MELNVIHPFEIPKLPIEKTILLSIMGLNIPININKGRTYRDCKKILVKLNPKIAATTIGYIANQIIIEIF